MITDSCFLYSFLLYIYILLFSFVWFETLRKWYHLLCNFSDLLFIPLDVMFVLPILVYVTHLKNISIFQFYVFLLLFVLLAHLSIGILVFPCGVNLCVFLPLLLSFIIHVSNNNDSDNNNSKYIQMLL